jgi:secreted Zn-dependent insulinase-like peptidase
MEFVQNNENQNEKTQKIVNIETQLMLDKLENDKCEYTYFTLSNKLNVFVVYDKDAINSAVAMRVNVGYMED